MGTRRENGAGNVYQRSNGKYTGRLQLGVGPDGKAQIKYFSGKTAAEVKKKMRQYNKETFIQPDTITVQQYMERWLKQYKQPFLKASSYDRLERTAKNQIYPVLGAKKLQSLCADDIQELINECMKNGYSHSSVKKIYDSLNDCLKHAVANKDLSANPMNVVRCPSKNLFECKEHRALTPEEITRLRNELGREYSTGAKVYPYGAVFLLMLNTGIREGEALGLHWTDVDLDNRVLTIRRDAQMVKNRDENNEPITGYHMIENSPKTQDGERRIHINENSMEALLSLKKCPNDGVHVVCNTQGKPSTPHQLTRTFKRVCDNAEIPNCTTHTLRRTFATYLASNGVNETELARAMGHSDSHFTYAWYVKPLEREQAAKLDMLDRIF
ncbi:MAG: tyrosine-type recombinase/integrase [Candidatus Onthomonas sp.]